MSQTQQEYWVIIPAAGCGSRMNSDTPKQYLPLCGKKVIEHSLSLFDADEDIAGIVVVADTNDNYISEVLASCSNRVFRVDGGAERADSVMNGLNWLIEQQVNRESCVLVHDAARPCLSVTDLDKLKASVGDFPDGAILVAPVVDTLKQVNGSNISKTHDRAQFRRALTPQMAPLGVLHHALKQANKKNLCVTDEAQALELAGVRVGVVEGQRNNLKITYPEDLALAEFVLQSRAK